jgi:hypothetical protein
VLLLLAMRTFIDRSGTLTCDSLIELSPCQQAPRKVGRRLYIRALTLHTRAFALRPRPLNALQRNRSGTKSLSVYRSLGSSAKLSKVAALCIAIRIRGTPEQGAICAQGAVADSNAQSRTFAGCCSSKAGQESGTIRNVPARLYTRSSSRITVSRG